jgi:SAM-dependent methyltransferase
VKLGLTFLLTEVAGLWYFLSYGITLATVVVYSFVYNAYVTFGVGGGRKRFARYCVVLFSFLIADAAAVRTLTDVFGVRYLVSILAVTTVLFACKYVVYDTVVFVHEPHRSVAGNYYDKHGSRNPVVRCLMRRYFAVLWQIMDDLKPRSVLEAGCGEGAVTDRIAKRYPEAAVEGSDVDPGIIRVARERYGDRYRVESVYALERSDASTGVVALLEVLEHLEDPDRALEEAKRVGAVCVFSVPHEPYWRLANVMRLAYLRDFGNTPGHINHWSRRGFQTLLERHFGDVRIRKALLWNFAVCRR